MFTEEIGRNCSCSGLIVTKMKDQSCQRPHKEILFEHETYTEESRAKAWGKEREIEVEWGGERPEEREAGEGERERERNL